MSMMLFRNANENDLVSIYGLAQSCGPGMTTLPNDIKLINRRLRWTQNSFNKTILEPQDEYYFFVLENVDEQKVVGTSAIEAYLGFHSPFYSYKLLKHTRICPSLDIRNDYELLALVNNYQGCSEICTLYLNPQYRCNGNGLLLSRARFLFMSCFPERFADMIIAEMRGVSDAKGQSPFWNAVASHFFKMNFKRADRLTLSTNKQFIADLMPRQPVYISLLSKKAQDVIGKPHASTLPAMKILFKEGFIYNDYIDIFDAGPTIEAIKEQIFTVKNNLLLEVKISNKKKLENHRFIISNTSIDFKATITHAQISNKNCTVTKEVAELLNVESGDLIRVIPLAPQEYIKV